MLHRRNRRLGAQEHARRVDLQNPFPVIERRFHDRHATVQGRVVDENVHFPKGFDCLANGPLPVVLRRNVQRNEQCPTAGLVDLRLDLLALVLQYVSDDHGCPFAGKQRRLGGPLPSGAPGDQRNLAFESHAHPPKSNRPKENPDTGVIVSLRNASLGGIQGQRLDCQLTGGNRDGLARGCERPVSGRLQHLGQRVAQVGGGRVSGVVVDVDGSQGDCVDHWRNRRVVA